MSDQKRKTPSRFVNSCRGKCVGLESNDVCGDEHEGWTCTLKPGHKGRHVACGTRTHNLGSWENKGR